MFKQRILDSIRVKYRALDTLSEKEIGFKGEALTIKGYDLVNMALVQNCIVQSSRTSITSPSDKIFSALNILAGAIQLAVLDLEDTVDDLARTLKPGDLVKLDGCLGVFREYDGSMFRLQFKKPKGKYSAPIVGVPYREAHHIIKYDGKATALQTYRFEHLMDIGKSVLASILCMDADSMKKILHKRRMLIVSDRGMGDECLDNLTVTGKKFTDIFPVAYYSSSMNIANIGHRSSQKSPNICIVPDMQSAIKFIKTETGQPVRSIYIDDMKSLKYCYSVLDQYTDFGYMLRVSPSQIEHLQELDEYGFQTWLWQDSDSYWIHDSNEHPDSVVKQRDTARSELSEHYINSSIMPITIETAIIDMPDGWEELFDRLLSNLGELKQISETYHSEVLERFQRIAWNLTIALNSASWKIPDNDEYCSENMDTINESIVKLNSSFIKIDSSILPNELQNIPEKIINIINELRGILQIRNPRSERMLEVLKRDWEIDAIVVRKRSYIPVTNNYLNRNGLYGVEVIAPTDFIHLEAGARILVPSWIKKEFLMRLHDCPGISCTMILNKTEMQYYYNYTKWFRNIVISHSSSEYRSQMLGISVKFPESAKELNKEEKSVESIDIFDYESIISSISEAARYASLRSENSSSTEEKCQATPVIFEEDACGFFTDGYTAKVVDFKRHDYEKKSISEVRVGDQLIFARSSRRDIFDLLIEDIESQPEVMDLISTSKQWWRILKAYMEQNEITVEEMTEILRKNGHDYSRITVEAWIEGQRIRPGSYDVIEFILKLCNSGAESSTLSEIANACRQRTALHIKAGRYLIGIIARATSNKNIDSFDSLIERSAVDLSKHARIYTVQNIDNSMITVLRSECNRILEF